MSELKNDRFIRAIYKQPVDRTPIWIMRQAGRYLPEYRAVREKAGSFMTLCQTPELACEVTLQPLRRYDLDASIIFSDILTIPDAMGLGLSFAEGEGPRFASPIRTERDSQRLHVPDLEKLRYVYDAIKMARHELNGKVPLIGFCGSPWTLAAYVIEGRSKNGFPTVLQMLREQPLQLHHILDVLAESVVAHLNAQIEAGAQAVMVFDTWGGLLETPEYLEFSLYYVQQIIAGVLKDYNNRRVPFILFTKGGGRWLAEMSQTGCDMLGLDWTMPLGAARAQVGTRVALQGNMNPATLLQLPDDIRREAADILASYGKGSGHVFNLGHGITPDVPPENVEALVQAVHELSRPYHEVPR
jgi:uroporphyrinogen decarboxylase